MAPCNILTSFVSDVEDRASLLLIRESATCADLASQASPASTCNICKAEHAQQTTMLARLMPAMVLNHQVVRELFCRVRLVVLEARTRDSSWSFWSFQLLRSFYLSYLEFAKMHFGSFHKKEEGTADIEAYAATFRNCRKRVEDSLAMVEAGSLSWDSIKEFTQSLRDIDQVVVDSILKQRGDVFQSKPVLNLVNEYFQASFQTLELVNELENCLKVVESNDFVLRLATRKFENKKYVEMTENLEKFKAKGDPFKETFWLLYVKLCEEQLSLLNKVMQMHVELNKKKPKEKRNGVIDLLSEAVGAIFKILMAIARKLRHQDDTVPVEPQTEQKKTDRSEPEDTVWMEQENEMRKAKHVLATVSTSNCVVKEFEDFRAHVLSLTEKITSQETDVAMEDEAAKSAVDELKTDVNKFHDDLSNMVAHTRKCRDDIFSGREKVLGLIKSCTSHSPSP